MFISQFPISVHILKRSPFQFLKFVSSALSVSFHALFSSLTFPADGILHVLRRFLPVLPGAPLGSSAGPPTPKPRSEELRGNREFMLAAVAQDGRALQYASEEGGRRSPEISALRGAMRFQGLGQTSLKASARVVLGIGNFFI